MPRYFIELSYKGTAFQGFQIQDKGITVQGEVNKTLQTYYRQPVQTTTSSRTDSGVHARQNFLHFDADFPIRQKDLFHLNCIIHPDIVFQNIYTCKADAHCRFDALSRSYSYFLERKKEPFLQELRYYFPFSLNPGILKETADIIQRTRNFQSFAKRNSDVTNYECHIYSSEWIVDEEKNLCFKIKGNRFLRGMVRALVATQLNVGRGKITIGEFESVIASGNCTMADFGAPAKGLFLDQVEYPYSIDLQKVL